MSDFRSEGGVWFVYDGDCPVCKLVAEALRIQKRAGPLRLLDARVEAEHPLIVEINKRSLGLDDGMVIHHQGHYYHGGEALHFMAIYGAPDGLFNHFNRLLFRSRYLAKTLYPSLRAGRNLLLRVRGIGRIKNLIDAEQPIFKPIFGDSWHAMPPVMHRHYANRPFCRDVNIAEGVMTVRTAPVLRLAAPLLRLIGGIPAVNAENIPVTVRFESEERLDALHFKRSFRFPGNKPYVFHSRMMPRGGNRIVERMKYGLGWCVGFLWQDNKVMLQHEGFCLCLFGKFIPLPISWLIGSINAEEWALDDKSFAMSVEIRHPLFGKIYEYSGEYSMVAASG